MSRYKILCIAALLTAITATTAFAAGIELKGSVSGPDGKPMEGVAVSARNSDKTYTTTVFTDETGKYFFPELEGGDYKIWAQAKGYEYVSSEDVLADGKKAEKNFTLKGLKDYLVQLSGAELLESLPDQPGDSRIKREITSTCGTNCHQLNFNLQNRFDLSGWNKILDVMEKIRPGGYVYPSNFKDVRGRQWEASPYIHAYRDEIAAYLTRVRGPNPTEVDYHAFRPTGEATHVVITEWNIPPAYRPNDYTIRHDGSNWSEGTPSALNEGWGVHDTWSDKNGIVWFCDDVTADRTIGKLDTRTGKVTSYALPDDKGNPAVRAHGITLDQAGYVWLTDMAHGSLDRFDPKTEKFTVFPKPAGAQDVQNTVIVDSKGNIWAPNDEGAFKLDPKTGKYTVYDSPVKGGGAYGIAADSKDNVWWVRIGNDRLDTVDSKMNEVSEIIFDDSDLPDVTQKDKDIRAKYGASGGGVGVTTYQRGPRRPAADANGDTVWVPMSYADRVARVNINTRKVTEFPLPEKYVVPYAAGVDKNHMVWINLENADRIAKFNPFTEKWTEYLLPTHGAETHHISVDDSTPNPTIYLGYYRTNKIARIQFR